MKPVLIIALIFGINLNVFAQVQPKDEPNKRHIELGVNATSFVENFISFGSDVESVSPFTFHFKLIKNNRGLRVNAGFNARVAQDDSNGFREFSSITNDLKIGYEKRTLASKRWMVMYGVDAIVDYTFSKSLSINFEQVIVKNQRTGFGLSPFIGFAFNLTPKIYLSTEASIDALYSITLNEAIFDDPSVPDQKDEFNSFRISTELPTNLFFTIKF